ncbi:MAG: hypothetical protein QW129_05525, partial [Thermoplasmata archaeon]
MFKIIKKILIVFIFLILLTTFSINSSSKVTLTYSYPSQISGKIPCIKYDNSTNFIPYWSTNINSYGDRAYMNLSSVWSQDIYVDDYGNVFWVDNWGNVFFWSIYGNVYSISTPYYHGFSFAGRIVSISVINDTYVDYVALLTEYGFVFVYNMNSGTWFNATKVWNLNLQSVWSQYHSPWTSVTSNLLGDDNGYHELFIFTNLNGEVYAFDTTYNATSRTNYG